MRIGSNVEEPFSRSRSPPAPLRSRLTPRLALFVTVFPLMVNCGTAPDSVTPLWSLTNRWKAETRTLSSVINASIRPSPLASLSTVPGARPARVPPNSCMDTPSPPLPAAFPLLVPPMMLSVIVMIGRGFPVAFEPVAVMAILSSSLLWITLPSPAFPTISVAVAFSEKFA